MLKRVYQSVYSFPLALGLLSLVVLLTNAIGRANFPFWPDEAYTTLAVRARDWNELLSINLQNEATPPLYFMVLRLWAMVWGDSREGTLRLFSATCTAATAPLVGWLGQRLWSKRVGLAGALLLGVNPFAHYYGQEARAYALSLLITAVLLLAAHYYLCQHSLLSLAIYTLAGSAALYTSYFAGFVLAGIGSMVGALLLRNAGQLPRQSKYAVLGKWILAHVIILLVFLPWLPEIYYQQTAVANPTLTPEGRNLGMQYALALLALGSSLPDGSIVGSALAILVAISLPIAATLAFYRGNLEQRLFLIATVAAPPLCVLLLVFRGDGQFNTRYIISSLTPFVLMLAAGLVQRWRGQALTRTLLAAIIALAAIYSLSVRPSSQRLGGWDKLAQIVEAQAQQGEAVFFAPPWAQPAFTVQYTGMPLSLYGTSSFASYYYEQGHSFNEDIDQEHLGLHLQSGKRAWIVWDHVYAREPQIPQGYVVQEHHLGSTSLLLVTPPAAPNP